MANALPILLLGGAALLMMGGKKTGGGGGASRLPSVGIIPPGTLGPKTSYNPKTGSSSGYPKISRTQMVEIQNKLVALGFSVGAKGPDGLYGPDTHDAVLAFQKKYMKKSEGWDGKPGSKTQTAIDEQFGKLTPAQQAAAQQAATEDKAVAETKKAPIIYISNDTYYNKFINTTERAIVCITTAGHKNLFVNDPKKEALARHNGKVFIALLEAAAIANAGKIRFGLADASFGLVQPLQTKVNGRGYPQFFPMMVGLSGEDDVFGFGMSMDGGETTTKKATDKMQKLVADVLGAGNA